LSRVFVIEKSKDKVKWEATVSVDPQLTSLREALASIKVRNEGTYFRISEYGRIGVVKELCK